MSSNIIFTITNNLGCDVDIYDVFNPNPNAPLGTAVALTYTKLTTVPKGATAQKVQPIRAASQVQAMVTGNIEGLNNNYYQQFPVAAFSVSKFSDTLDFTLTSDIQQAMIDSFEFIKYIQANPSTALATGFRTAIAAKNENAVTTFLKGTGSFKNCTYSTWITVFTWQCQFTSPWQGTYYLYRTDSSSTDSSSAASTAASTLVATLVITSDADDSSAVLTMAAQGGQSTPVIMPGDGTMQEINAGTGPLSVTLSSVWANVVQTNQKTGDSYTVIGAAFGGTINNTKVVGNLNKLVIPSIKSASPSFGSVLTSICDYSDKFASLIGILAAVGTVCIMYKDIKAAEKQRKLDAEKEAENEKEAKASALRIEKDSDTKFQAIMSKLGPSVEIQASQAPTAYNQVAVAENVQKDMTAVVGEGQKLAKLLEHEPSNTDIEDAMSNIGDAEDSLDKADQSGTSMAGAQGDLNKVDTTIADTSENLDNEVKSEGNTVSQIEKKAETEVEEVEDGVNKATNNAEEAMKTEEANGQKSASDDVDPDNFQDAKPQD